jgi:soluble lytic murein transglycosylase-like protein
MVGWKAVLLAAGGLAAVLLPQRARAEIYMYRDQHGVLHFSNAPADPVYQRWAPSTAGFRVSSQVLARDTERRKAFDPLIVEAAQRNRVEPALVKAVIRAESDFVPYARSPKGALGLMQLMPATARMHNVWSVFEPKDNIEGGVRHLRLLLDQYNGNVRLALAAYNAGDAAVERHGGIPPYPETIEYLERVLRFREQYLREP